MPTNTKDAQFAELMSGQLDEIKMSNTTLDNAIEWIVENLEPEEVFAQKQLVAWAENNGYVKE